MRDKRPNVMPDVVMSGADRQEMERYLQDELRAQQRDPLNNSYPLHGQQMQFVADIWRWIIVVAANRVGKTEGAMRDTLWCARGKHPYKDIELHSVIWIGCPDYPSYLRFTKPAFDKWCPPGWIVGSFHDSEKWVKIRRIDGGICTIHFLSYDMPRTKWQGAGVDRIWLDEEPPEDIFGECLARIVTTRGSILLTFTPVEGIGWWNDRIWDPAKKGLNNWHCYTAALATFDDDNLEDCNVGEVLVPHLSRTQVIEFASQYPDPDERAIRVFGMIRSRAGLVFKSYDTEVHYIGTFDVPRHWPVWGGLDPGFHGFAAELFTQDEDENVYRIAEYYSSHEPTSIRLTGLVDMTLAVRPAPAEKEAEPWHPYQGEGHVAKEMMEPIVFFVDTEDPQTIMELNILADGMGAPVAFASLDQGLKARKAGILRMQQLLQPSPARAKPKYVQRESLPVGEPVMYLCQWLGSEWRDKERLVSGDRLNWEIQRFSWKPVTRSGTNPDDANDMSAGGAHALSAARYAVMARLGPPAAPGSEKSSERNTMSAAERAVWDEMDRIEEAALAEAEEMIEWE